MLSHRNYHGLSCRYPNVIWFFETHKEEFSIHGFNRHSKCDITWNCWLFLSTLSSKSKSKGFTSGDPTPFNKWTILSILALRSPEFTSLDFHFLGYVKTNTNNSKHWVCSAKKLNWNILCLPGSFYSRVVRHQITFGCVQDSQWQLRWVYIME